MSANYEIRVITEVLIIKGFKNFISLHIFNYSVIDKDACKKFENNF